LLFTVEAVGFCIIAFKPFNTVGVFCTILVFDALPADPAAAARTALCASSSDSALKAVVASDLMLFADVSSGSWFKLAETVLASLAKFVVACWTAAIDGILEEDPDAALVVPPFIEPFVLVVCPEDAFAVVDCPVEALAVLEPEDFEVASVLTSLKSRVVFDAAVFEFRSGVAVAVVSLESTSLLNSRDVT